MLSLLLTADTSHVLDINAQTKLGFTPLHVAIKELWRCQDVLLFDALFKAGADVSTNYFKVV